MRAAITMETLLSPANCSTDRIEISVQCLLQIKSDIAESTYPPMLEENIEQKLIELESYPCDKLFNKNISNLKDCIYSGRDVSRLVNNILEMAEKISSILPENICEWNELSLSPSISFSAERTSHITELFATVALGELYSAARTEVIYPFAAGICSVNFSGTISNIYPDFVGGTPKKLSSNISIFPSYTDYVINLDPEKIFASAKNEYDIKSSIYIGALHILKIRGRNYANLLWCSFTLGESFIESLKDHQCYYGQKYFGVCFDTICHVVAGVDKNPINPFLQRKGSTEQRRKGDALAWRTHITKRHEALRFMFWKDSYGNIELANIGNKSELSIK